MGGDMVACRRVSTHSPAALMVLVGERGEGINYSSTCELAAQDLSLDAAVFFIAIIFIILNCNLHSYVNL